MVCVGFDSGWNYFVYPETVRQFYESCFHTSEVYFLPESKWVAMVSHMLLQTMKKKNMFYAVKEQICFNTHHYEAGSTSTQIEDKQAEETVTYIIIKYLFWGKILN